MPHRATLPPLLNLEDPIDQEIAKLNLSRAQSLTKGSRGLFGRSALAELRDATIRGGTDALGTLALDLFPGIVLPDFLKPLPEPEEPASEPSGETKAVLEELELQETFGLLFSDALAVTREGTGREDLVREGS